MEGRITLVAKLHWSEGFGYTTANVIPERLETDARGMMSWRRGRWWYSACPVAQHKVSWTLLLDGQWQAKHTLEGELKLIHALLA